MSWPSKRRTRGLIAILLVSLGSPVGSFAASQKHGTPQPELLMERTRHDFGEVFAGEVLTCVFNVRNGGGRALELSELGLPPPSNDKPPAKPIGPALRLRQAGDSAPLSAPLSASLRVAAVGANPATSYSVINASARAAPS